MSGASTPPAAGAVLATDPRSGLIASPVFMVGSVRSGTTWLRLMVGHHPQIAANPEFGMAVDRLGPDGSFPPLDAYRGWLETDRIARLYGFDVDPSLDYPHLVDSFLRQRAARERKPIVTATVHHRFDCLLRIWPDARFLYLVRDPRDVARSVVQMGWAGNVWRGCDRWIEAEACWERLKAALPAERRLELRYEDLVRDPRAALERVCAFYGVDFDEAMLDYSRDSSYAPPDPALAEQWRRRLRPYEVRLIEARTGPQLLRRGYAPSGEPPLRVGALRARALDLASWWGKVRFRVRRNGLPLFLLDFLARRLHWRALERRTKLRINEIENATLH